MTIESWKDQRPLQPESLNFDLGSLNVLKSLAFFTFSARLVV